MKKSLISLILVLTVVQANLRDGKDELWKPHVIYPSTVLHYVDKFWEIAKKLKHRKYKRIWQHPEPGPFKFVDGNKKVRGNNIIEDTWWAVIDFLGAWTEDSWWLMFSTLSAYFFIPLVGGYFKGQAHQEYRHDPDTMREA